MVQQHLALRGLRAFAYATALLFGNVNVMFFRVDNYGDHLHHAGFLVRAAPASSGGLLTRLFGNGSRRPSLFSRRGGHDVNARHFSGRAATTAARTSSSAGVVATRGPAPLANDGTGTSTEAVGRGPAGSSSTPAPSPPPQPGRSERRTASPAGDQDIVLDFDHLARRAKEQQEEDRVSSFRPPEQGKEHGQGGVHYDAASVTPQDKRTHRLAIHSDEQNPAVTSTGYLSYLETLGHVLLPRATAFLQRELAKYAGSCTGTSGTRTNNLTRSEPVSCVERLQIPGQCSQACGTLCRDGDRRDERGRATSTSCTTRVCRECWGDYIADRTALLAYALNISEALRVRLGGLDEIYEGITKPDEKYKTVRLEKKLNEKKTTDPPSGSTSTASAPRTEKSPVEMQKLQEIMQNFLVTQQPRIDYVMAHIIQALYILSLVPLNGRRPRTSTRSAIIRAVRPVPTLEEQQEELFQSLNRRAAPEGLRLAWELFTDLDEIPYAAAYFYDRDYSTNNSSPPGQLSSGSLRGPSFQAHLLKHQHIKSAVFASRGAGVAPGQEEGTSRARKIAQLVNARKGRLFTQESLEKAIEDGVAEVVRKVKNLL
ncbi:unnamed protein product [Amoebophrya sp. A120]|nr:unnamed protein product [Amoebophrya sp. A120]|eukprot:GSA120T00019681001.1